MQAIDYLCKFLHNETYRRSVSASKCAVAIANVMESKSCSNNCSLMESCATVLRNLSCIENEGNDPVVACTHWQLFLTFMWSLCGLVIAVGMLFVHRPCRGFVVSTSASGVGEYVANISNSEYFCWLAYVCIRSLAHGIDIVMIV